MIQVLQTNKFAKQFKKIHPKERNLLELAIRKILEDPFSGMKKRGDLSHIRVFKYKIKTKQYLLAYEYNEINSIIFLVAIGTHENFYRDLQM